MNEAILECLLRLNKLDGCSSLTGHWVSLMKSFWISFYDIFHNPDTALSQTWLQIYSVVLDLLYLTDKRHEAWWIMWYFWITLYMCNILSSKPLHSPQVERDWKVPRPSRSTSSIRMTTGLNSHRRSSSALSQSSRYQVMCAIKCKKKNIYFMVKSSKHVFYPQIKLSSQIFSTYHVHERNINLVAHPCAKQVHFSILLKKSL